MLKWLKGLFSKKKTTVYHYGRYELKPVTDRALSVVMGISKEQLEKLVRAKKLTLNEAVLYPNDLGSRLESGSYQITLFASKQVWHFHID